MIKISQLRIQLSGNSLRRLRHKGLQKGRAHHNSLHQVVEHRGQPVPLALILGQYPGLRFIYIFVAASENRKHLRQGIRHPQGIHFFHDLRIRPRSHSLQITVHLLSDRSLVCHNPAEVLIAHGYGAFHQIPQNICQIRVGPLGDQLPGSVSVIVIGHLMQHIVPYRVHPEKVHQIVHIDHISFGLAHLAAVHHQPWMSEHLLRQRLPQSHQKDGPVNGVETDNVLTDQMQIGRPKLPVLIRAVSIGIIADAGNIVCQSIQPYVHNMLFVKVHRNPPLEGGSGHTQILQARQKEIIHHLVFAGHRLNKLRMLIDMLYQPVRIFAHTEKVCLLPGRLHLPAAVGALTVHQLGFRPEGFAGSTVHSLIGALIDISLFIKTPENLLYLLFMVLVGCADKLVIRNIQHIAHSPDNACHLVHKFPGSYSCLLGLQLDLLAMLVRPRLEKHLISFLPAESCNTVCHHDLIIIADMRLS